MKILAQPVNRTCAPRVGDIMQRQIVSVPETTTIEDLAFLLVSHNISGVPVVNKESRVVGIVSLSDLARHGYGTSAVRSRPWDMWEHELMLQDCLEGVVSSGMMSACVSDIMTSQTVSIREDAGLDELAALMVEHRIHRVIVQDGDRLVGLVTTMDVMKALPRLMPALDSKAGDGM